MRCVRCFCVFTSHLIHGWWWWWCCAYDPYWYWLHTGTVYIHVGLNLNYLPFIWYGVQPDRYTSIACTIQRNAVCCCIFCFCSIFQVVFFLLHRVAFNVCAFYFLVYLLYWFVHMLHSLHSPSIYLNFIINDHFVHILCGKITLNNIDWFNNKKNYSRRIEKKSNGTRKRSMSSP